MRRFQPDEVPVIALLLMLFGGTGAAAVDGGAVPDDAGTMTVAQANDAGYKLDYRVYSKTASDGGTVPVAVFPDGGVFVLDKFPCAKRAKGVAANALGCLAKLKSFDGGNITDFGDENVLQPGLFSGNGCTLTPCAIFSGDSAP